MRIALVAVLFFGACTSFNQSQAAWSLIENFNSMPLGGIDGESGWTVNAQPTFFNVVGDPQSSFTNRALKIQNLGNAEAGAFRSLGAGIPEGGTGTLFFRVRNVSTSADMAAGASDEAEPTGFGSFESQFLTTNGSLRIRDNNASPNVKTLRNYTSNIWTNIWMVIDNAADMTTLYSTTGTSNATGTPSVVGAFRNGTTDSLVNFQIRSAIAQLSAAYIDDIYLDLAGGNLTRPTLATSVRGDVNGDGVVTPEDLAAIQANYNQPVTLRSQGDLNNDGVVDLIDFREWKDFTSFGSGSSSFATVVPEPISVSILPCGLICLAARRKRRAMAQASGR